MTARRRGFQAVVLGTGAADGIPQPFCDCTTCTDARRQGYSRFGGGVLIDDTLLIDAPSSTSAAAARAGVDLRGVRVIAVTHAHHDHWDPAILLHRQWILDRGEPLPPLTLIGPPTVLETARGWLPPGSDVTLVPAVAGATHEMAGMRLRVVPSTHGRTIPGKASDPWADEAVLFEVRPVDDLEAKFLFLTLQAHHDPVHIPPRAPDAARFGMNGIDDEMDMGTVAIVVRDDQMLVLQQAKVGQQLPGNLHLHSLRQLFLGRPADGQVVDRLLHAT